MIQGCCEHCLTTVINFLSQKGKSYLKSVKKEYVVSIDGPMQNPEGKEHLNTFYN